MLTPQDLVGQFLLCKALNMVPEGWRCHERGGWYLGCHPALPVIDILAADARGIGWLLGWPISSEGLLVEEKCRFDVRPDDVGAGARFESLLYEYGGRYAAVLLTPGVARFYLDPFGSLAAVFSAQRQVLASSLNLVPRAAAAENSDCRAEMCRLLEPSAGRDTRFPFGLTPRLSVERLLPNHFLDLTTWQSQRHWPQAELPVAADVNALAEEVAVVVKRHLAAIARQYPIQMSLTGGRDTRMLLACAREVLERIRFFTLAVPHEGGRQDCAIARRIAAQCRLPHRIVTYEPATAADAERWLNRTGGCVGTWHCIRGFESLDAECPVLCGTGGELSRSFHWRQGDTETSTLTAEALLRKHRIPVVPELQEAAERWLSDVPIRNALSIWSLFHLEQELGCWAGPLYYGLTHSKFYLLPFCHRKAVEAMLRVPPEHKRRQGLEHDLLAGQWPELLRWPFNWPMGFARYPHAVRWRLRSLLRNLASPAGAPR